MGKWLNFKSETSKQFFRFIAVGLINLAVCGAVFYLTIYVLNIHYVIGSTLAYVFGIFTSFYLNRYWTFNSKDNKQLIQLTKFVILSLICLGINDAVITFSVEGLKTSIIAGQIIAVILTTVANFLGSKLIVFRKKEEMIKKYI